MAIEVGSNSSYIIPTDVPTDTALGYSRHYAKKIHDLGKTSRETWIQTLVDHVLHGPNPKRPFRGGGQDFKRTSDSDDHSPKMPHRRKQDHTTGFDLAGATSRRDGRIMNSLQNSPYLPKSKIAQENPVYLRKIVQNRDMGKTTSRSRESSESKRQKEASLDVSDTQSNSSMKSHHYPPIKSAPAFKENKARFIPQELAQSPYVSNRNNYTVLPLEKILSRPKKPQKISSRGGNRLRRSDPAPRTANPYLSGTMHHHNSHGNTHLHPHHQHHHHISNSGPPRAEAWKPPSIPNNAEMMALEKRAKAAAAKAIQENKVFTCEGPYPVDAYVRFSLRKRGWVEKFGPKIHSSITNGKGTSSKLECEFDEDFDIICHHNTPAPWEEEHGVYAMMSRLVRHRPARFIWAGRAVNSLVLHQEVIVNHFPKARTFSSKTGIANSLRDLPWLASSDPQDFFPRCYLLSEEERDDLIDDFRLTACISLLKWVMQMFTSDETSERTVMPERSKTIEIIHEEDESEPQVPENEQGLPVSASKDEGEEPAINEANSSEGAEQPEKDPDQPDKDSETGERPEETDDDQNNNFPLEASLKEGRDDDLDEDADDPDFAPVSDSSSSDSDDDNIDKASTPINMKGSKRVKPKIVIHEKAGGEIPSKAVDWALGQCERFYRFKTHEDLDQKNKPNLSPAQWDQLLRWFYKVAHDGATVVVTQSKVQNIKDTLAKIRKLRRQYDIDGTRNIWIIKPGGKSKGIGIEFCNNLEDMLKYIDNTTLAGNYVVQKYIETPLLLYKTKFDIRQWFVVTDWNPLTVWFYKGCYLRICSQEYSTDTMHEAVHLSNVAIQQFYINGTREGQIPDDNYMNSADFEVYLASIGYPTVWADKIYPAMKKAVINTLLATMDIAENKKCAFELYGADFMISEAFVPWLLEINSSPGMAPQTKEKAKLCANVVEDLMKVVLDKRENKNSDTGGFELAFRDTPLPSFKSVDNRMFIEGSRIKRTDLHRYASLDNVVKSGEDPAKNDSLIRELKSQNKKTPSNRESGNSRGNNGAPRESVRGGAKQDGARGHASHAGNRGDQSASNRNFAKIYGNPRRDNIHKQQQKKGEDRSSAKTPLKKGRSQDVTAHNATKGKVQGSKVNAGEESEEQEDDFGEDSGVNVDARQTPAHKSGSKRVESEDNASETENEDDEKEVGETEEEEEEEEEDDGDDEGNEETEEEQEEDEEEEKDDDDDEDDVEETKNESGKSSAEDVTRQRKLDRSKDNDDENNF